MRARMPISASPGSLPHEPSSRALAASLLMLLATGMLLLRHDLRPSTRAMIVGTHMILGLATSAYGLRSLLRLFRLHVREFPWGWMLVLVSGVLLLFFGASRSWAGLVAAHALIATTYGARQLVPRRLAFVGAPALGLFLMTVSWDLTTERVPSPPALPPAGFQDATFAQTTLDLSAFNLDDGQRFTDLGRCDICHLKIAPAYAQSAHRHASLSNPAPLSNPNDQRALKALLAEEGPAAGARCVRCHDLGLAAHRKLLADKTPGDGISSSLVGADLGVPCLACHGATSAQDRRGGGALALALPDDPVVTQDGIRHTLSFWTTYVDPRSHREAMMPRGARSVAVCASCHQAPTLPLDLGGAHPQDLVDHATHAATVYRVGAGASGRLSLDTPVQNCVDCHLPLTDHGHAMLENQASSRAGLSAESSGMMIGLFAITENVLRAEGTTIDIATGQETEIQVLVSNEGVGHNFPGGRASAKPWWVEITVRDGGGRIVAQSPQEPARAQAATGKRRAIPPGDAELVRFRFRPTAPGSFQVQARLRRAPQETGAKATADQGSLVGDRAWARYFDAVVRDGDQARVSLILATAKAQTKRSLDFRLAQARWLLSKNDVAAAEALLRNEDDARALFLGAKARLQAADAAGAIVITGPLLETFGHDLELLRLDAAAREQAGDLQGALASLDELLRHRVNDGAALRRALAIASTLGRAAQVALYQRAVDALLLPPTVQDQSLSPSPEPPFANGRAVFELQTIPR